MFFSSCTSYFDKISERKIKKGRNLKIRKSYPSMTSDDVMLVGSLSTTFEWVSSPAPSFPRTSKVEALGVACSSPSSVCRGAAIASSFSPLFSLLVFFKIYIYFMIYFYLIRLQNSCLILMDSEICWFKVFKICIMNFKTNHMKAKFSRTN